MEKDIIDIEDAVEASTTPPPFKHTTKPWYVWIRQIIRLEDGTVYGLGSDSKMYNWHHSFMHAGKWVLLISGR